MLQRVKRKGFDKMTEKTFTQEKINKELGTLFESYMGLFQNGHIGFLEYTLIESIFTKLQIIFDECDAYE